MKKLCLHPLFIAGLILRLLLLTFLLPQATAEWYLPFLEHSTASMTLDPWSSWLASGGSPAAFPYGYTMWLVFLPLVLFCKVVSLPLHLAYVLTLMLADLLMLDLVRRLLPRGRIQPLLVYWFSPVVILATYGLGYNDLIPVTLLILSLYGIRQYSFRWAGAACMAAVSAKLSMVLALPFFLIYFYNNKAMRQYLHDFLIGFAICALVFLLPFALSPGGRFMLLSNPELDKVYRLALDLGGNVSVYVLPLIYLVMVYMAWRVRRLNFDLFQACAGMAFLLIVLLTPASPGWFVWSIPFLVLYQSLSGRMALILIAAYSVLYGLSILLIVPLHFSSGMLFDLRGLLHLDGKFGHHAASLLHTAMLSIGIVLAIRIWRETISHNNFFRLSRQPFVIGIAGDSGAGKDTFSDAIGGLFGKHSVVTISGDDYHNWDRQKPMWQVMTHLNPMANDLEGFSNDLISLVDGKSILSRHYDHATGKMSRPQRIASNDIIIASGLHALYLPIMREWYNLKIYLDIDEGLRRYFKIQRDVNQRGHTLERVLNSFDKREPDSERFIRSQAVHADLLLSLQPIHPRMLEGIDDKHPLRLKLTVRTRNGLNEQSLNRVLVGVCGLHVDIDVAADGAQVQMIIEGETSAADIALAAEMLCPRTLEFLDTHPRWEDGMAGLMQLITLSHINQALTKRFKQ